MIMKTLLLLFNILILQTSFAKPILSARFDSERYNYIELLRSEVDYSDKWNPGLGLPLDMEGAIEIGDQTIAKTNLPEMELVKICFQMVEEKYWIYLLQYQSKGFFNNQSFILIVTLSGKVILPTKI